MGDGDDGAHDCRVTGGYYTNVKQYPTGWKRVTPGPLPAK